MTEPDIEACRACTKRVTDWFVSTLEPDGTIRDELDLIAYYHAPNLLAVTDRSVEAQRMANWLAKNALADDGDFRYQNAKGGIIQPSMQWNYINGWLVWGLGRLGRFDLTERAAGFSSVSRTKRRAGFSRRPIRNPAFVLCRTPSTWALLVRERSA
ncbi:MAG: hypothetical protein E2P02_20075 [Acidobacteria bacterium]|nr:MAG: hypothetical protein E2P02_20075 [Acidobacteriota bacterium]